VRGVAQDSGLHLAVGVVWLPGIVGLMAFAWVTTTEASWARGEREAERRDKPARERTSDGLDASYRRIPCPRCSRMIPSSVGICPYCGEIQFSRSSTKRQSENSGVRN
jgi:predicted RNA-binding Zn-ribbon protein involved in translation (DUF1610 family)